MELIFWIISPGLLVSKIWLSKELIAKRLTQILRKSLN